MVGMVKQTQHNTSVQFYFQINFQLFVFVYYSLHVLACTVIHIGIHAPKSILKLKMIMQFVYYNIKK